MRFHCGGKEIESVDVHMESFKEIPSFILVCVVHQWNLERIEGDWNQKKQETHWGIQQKFKELG